MGLFGDAAKAVLPFGMLDMFAPDEADAATYPGFVKLFPKLVTVKGRKELRNLGLLDDNGRMYVGTLEPEVFEALKKRDKSVIDDNVWISRHAVDRRMQEGIKPEDLARDIAALIDSNEAKVLGNFPARFPQPDRAKWMLAGKKGNTYTAAPLRTGEFGDVELKTAFEPFGGNKSYLDKNFWGGALVPFLFTQEQLPEQSNTQLPRLSAVRNPYPGNIIPKGGSGVNADDVPANSVVWPIQTPSGRLIWRADTPEAAPQEPSLGTPIVDPIDVGVAPLGATTWGGRAAAMITEPIVSYGADRAFRAMLGLLQKKTGNGGGGI